MSRLALIASFFLFMSFPGALSSVQYSSSLLSPLPPSLMAQEPASEGGHDVAAGEHPVEGEHAEGEEHSLFQEVSHYLNFLVLAGVIIWAVKKKLIPFLNERGQLIREDMQKSSAAIEQANQRLKAMEDRLGNLDRELASLRETGLNEARAERARIEKEAEVEASKILSSAHAEMDSAVKAARQELQSYASQLALNVAEKKIKESLTPQSDKQILNSFIDRLAGSADGNAGGRKN